MMASNWEAMKQRRSDDRKRRALSRGITPPDFNYWQMQRAHFYAYANRCAFARGRKL